MEQAQTAHESKQDSRQETKHETKDDKTLMTQYVGVVNQALAKHEDTFVLKNLIDVVGRTVKGKRVGVAVYSSSPDSPHNYFTLRYNDAKRFEIVAHGKEEPAFEWKVKRSHLDAVVANPSKYIEHPLMLDWEWLKSRAGFDA
jgi:hypothetical protein